MTSKPVIRSIIRFVPVLLIVAALIIVAFKYVELRIQYTDKHEVVPFNVFSTSGETTTYPLTRDGKVHNIILYIGDGMGISQIVAAQINAFGPNGRLNIERMPVTGMLFNHSMDNLITESAASATALATGYKTHNRMVSITPDGTKLLTILEAARDNGLATGLVATSKITHATPACFAAHVASRSDYATIATQLIEARVNVLLGGGKEDFMPKSANGSRRSDEIDLIAKSKEIGYTFVETKKDLQAAEGNYILGLFQLSHLTCKSPEPTLSELTAKAIQILSSDEDGFFLMVEGSQIDWAGHQNNIDYCIRELLMFDNAVKIGLDYALQDEHTLVIVTADHETGGLYIIKGDIKKEKMEINWLTRYHTGTPVPLFAFGPNASRFTGMRDNTEIPMIFAELLGIKSFPSKME